MGSSGGGGSTSGMTDFPQYMKDFHGAVLNHSGADSPVVSVIDSFNYAASGNSPYYNYITNTEPISDAFMGVGKTIGSYSRIFELLKSYQDIDLTPFTAVLNSTSTTVEELMQAVSVALDDDIESTILPKFRANMRSVGAVTSSAFVMGEALIWDSKIKALAKERLNIEQIVNQNKEIALKFLTSYIEIKRNIALTTIDVTKYYYALKTDLDDHYANMHAKDLRWELELFQYCNNSLSSISGAALSQGTSDKAPSKVASAIGGALSGAAMGAMASSGNPIGAAVGGVIGLAGGLM